MTPELIRNLILLLQLYIAVGIAIIGFLCIVQRTDKIRPFARWWFWRPIESAFFGLWRLFVRILKWMLSPLLKK